MSLQMQVIEGVSPTSTGNQTVSTNFQAVAIKFRFTHLTATGNSTDAGLGIGFCDNSLNQCSFWARAQNTSGTPAAYKRQNVSSCITVTNNSGTVIAEGAVTSINSGNFVINWTTAPATGICYTATIWGGADITKSNVVTAQCPSPAANQNITIASGTPQCVLVASCARTASGTSTNGGGACDLILGCAVSTSSRWASGFEALPGASTYTASLQRTNQFVTDANPSASPSTYLLADIGAISSGQITVDWADVDPGATQPLFAYLALYGTFQVALFNNTMPSSTGNQANSLSFSPVGAILVSNGLAANTSAQGDAKSYSVGFYDGTNTSVMTAALDNSVSSGTTCNFNSVYSTSATIQVYQHATPPTKKQEGTINSLSSGVQVNFTSVDSGSEQYLGVAFGSSAGAPATPTGLAVTNDGSTPTTVLDISWNASSGATSYTLYQASTLGGTYSSVQSGIAGTSTTVTGLTPGTEYSFQIQAVNGGGSSANSSGVAWATEAAAPTALSATATTTSITVSFTAPTLGSNIGLAAFPTGNYLYKYESPVGSGFTGAGAITSNPFTITGLTAGTQYGIEMATVIDSTNGDWAGSIQGPWSSELAVVTPTGLPGGVPDPRYQSGHFGLTNADRRGRVEGVRNVWYRIRQALKRIREWWQPKWKAA